MGRFRGIGERVMDAGTPGKLFVWFVHAGAREMGSEYLGGLSR